jgi:endoglucanase
VGPNTADWRLGAQTAGNAILAVNPQWLIFVAGLGFDGWYGSDLRGAQSSPVVLTLPNQLVYSTRDLSQDAYIQPYFLDPSYPANLRDVWRTRWGYLQEQGTSPVFMGSFGTYFAYRVPDDQWLQTLVRYMNGEFTQDNQSNLLPGQKGMSWAVGIMSIGILTGDFQTANEMMPYLTASLAPALITGPLPTISPSIAPSKPSLKPSYRPSRKPSALPSSRKPSVSPSSKVPSKSPTNFPIVGSLIGKQVHSYYTVRGNQIVDATGSTVRIAAVNW